MPYFYGRSAQSPLRTVLTTLAVHGSVFAWSIKNSLVVNPDMALFAYYKSFSPFGYHRTLPILFPFQIFEFVDVILIAVTFGCATQFTSVCLQPLFKRIYRHSVYLRCIGNSVSRVFHVLTVSILGKIASFQPLFRFIRNTPFAFADLKLSYHFRNGTSMLVGESSQTAIFH